MDPTVTAAAIGVGGTVVVGVAGFSAAIWNTSKTIAHDRESRVWDQRADIYVEALAAVHYRQTRREYETQIFPPLSETSKRMQAYLAAYKEPDWYGMEARLQAFASEPVVTAMQASSTAHQRVVGAFGAWKSEEGLNWQTGAFIDTAASVAVDEARKAAEVADDAVIELIRTEMRGRGRPLGDWQPATAPNSALEPPR